MTEFSLFIRVRCLAVGIPNVKALASLSGVQYSSLTNYTAKGRISGVNLERLALALQVSPREVPASGVTSSRASRKQA